MSDTADYQGPDELTVLKQTADVMGIAYTDKVGVATLRERIKTKRELNERVAKESESSQNSPDSIEFDDEPPTMTLREWKRREALKLVRVRITNLDPKKSNWPGEIITVANKYTGNIKKYIPFDESTDNGYHIPYMLYNFLRTKKFLKVTIKKDKATGKESINTSWEREYSLDVLPQLTTAELEDLKKKQLLADSVQK